jgi:hypothetical protein
MKEFDREFQVYTDEEQCDLFETPYYSAPDQHPKLVIAASTLLASKDYDSGHRKFLSQFGSRTLVMQRTVDQGPGWWRVTEVI